MENGGWFSKKVRGIPGVSIWKEILKKLNSRFEVGRGDKIRFSGGYLVQ